MDFDRYDDWTAAADRLIEGLQWKTPARPVPGIIYETSVAARPWRLRINDFPDEPLYTLIVDGRDVIHFNDWPEVWRRPE